MKKSFITNKINLINKEPMVLLVNVGRLFQLRGTLTSIRPMLETSYLSSHLFIAMRMERNAL